MNEKLLHLRSGYIDVDLGLKYLNSNQKLYLKILVSFFKRYQNFDIHNIKEDEFENEMHILKGLSSTLGMEELSHLCRRLHQKKTEKLLSQFSDILSQIIQDLESLESKTVLIIDDHHEDINNIIEILGDNYDMMVITSPSDEIESIKVENIDIVLLNPRLSTPVLKHILKQKKFSIIELLKPLHLNNLNLAIKNL